MEKINTDINRPQTSDLNDCRRIDRYVWYQIKQMLFEHNGTFNDLHLGRLLKIDKDGILRVNMNSKLLDEDEKKYISTLIAYNRDDVFRVNQFEDLEERLEDKNLYNRWFDNSMDMSFMFTIPTRDVFYTNPSTFFYQKIITHSDDELNRERFSGYSIWQTLYALDIIDPFLVGMILGKEVEVYKANVWNTFIKFPYNGKILYALKDSIDLYELDSQGHFIKLPDTIHTLLFRHYQAPIYHALNSMMLPIGGDRVMPSEGLYVDPYIPELREETKEVLSSEKYKSLSKQYHLGYSRVSSRGY